MNLMFGLAETAGLDGGAGRCRRIADGGNAPLVATRAPAFRHLRAAHGGAHARLPWWGRGAIVAGPGRDHRRHVVVGLRLRPDLRRLQSQGNRGAPARRSRRRRENCRTEASELRARQLGARERAGDDARRAGRRSPSRQPSSRSENAQLKEELAFLQKLVSDSSKQVGLQIQRLAVERDGDDMWRYSLLIVRGGSPKDEFEGKSSLQAALTPVPGAPADARAMTLIAARGRAGSRSRRWPSNSSIISGLRAGFGYLPGCRVTVGRGPRLRNRDRQTRGRRGP